ncbi:MAG: TolC family protein [Myxococcota bacterium]
MLLLMQLGWAAEVRLELDDAVQRAWEQHADVLAQQARLDAAQAAVAPERAPDDPQFRGRMENVGSRTDAPQWTLRLRQQIEPIGAIRARVRAARAEAGSEAADLELLRSAVFDEVAAVFDAARFLEAAEALVSAERDACDAWIGIAQKRRDAGVGAADDVLEAQLARVSAVRRLVGVQRDGAAARAELGALVGLEPGDTLVLDGPDLADWVLEPPTRGESGEGSAEVERIRARVAEEEALRAQVAAEHRPWLDFVEGQVVLESGRVPSFGIAVAASLPVFSLTDGAVSAADARIQARRVELDAVARAEASRREASRAAHAAAVAAVRSLSEVVEEASAALEAEREGLTPDRYWELAADVARERQELLEVQLDAAVAKRAVERGLPTAR